LAEELDETEKQLEGIDQVIGGIKFLAGKSDLPDVSAPGVAPEPSGFTDLVRKILRESAVPLLPTEIRDRIRDSTVVTSDNLLVNIHTVLIRMVNIYHEAQAVEKDGRKAYRYIPKRVLSRLPPPPISPIKG
jgi:hypothetical protein